MGNAGCVVEVRLYPKGRRENGPLVFLQCYIESTSVRINDFQSRKKSTELVRYDTSKA